MASVSTVTSPFGQRLAKVVTSDRAQIVAITALFFLIACAIGLRLDIWSDEAYSLNTTGAGIAYALHQGIFFELQPPLYFILLAIWRLVDSSDFFARLFSIVAASATIPVAATFARRHISPRSGTPVAIVLAVNPFLLWTAEEIRVYALITFVSALITLFLFDSYFTETPTRASRVAFVAAAIAGLYTQYYLGSLLLAGGCAVLVFRRKRLPAYLLDMLFVALAAAPIGSFLKHQLTIANSPAPTPHQLRTFVSTVVQFVAPHGWIKGSLGQVLFDAAFACAVLFAVTFVRNHRSALGPRLAVARLSVVAVVIIAFFTILVARYPSTFYFPRHVTALFVPLELTVLALAACAPGGFANRVVAFIILIEFGLGVVADVGEYRDFEKPGHWRQVAHYLEAHARPGEPILVYNGIQTIPLLHVFHGPNTVIGVPGPPHFESRGPLAETVVNRPAFARLMHHSLSSNGSLWLVETTLGPYYAAGANTIAAELASSFDVITVKRFGNSSVEQVRDKR